jgi:hypothetical protein
MFTANEYKALHALAFSDQNPGYRPEVKEIPNGDGAIDQEKRYAHVAWKYIDLMPRGFAREFFESALYCAHQTAHMVASALEVPKAFWPDVRFSALRVLEYPIGAGSAQHTDFDLFTCLLYRSTAGLGDDDPLIFIAPEGEQEDSKRWRRQQKIHRGLHVGELGELIGLGPADAHAVLAHDEVQHSIVYFAIPDHAAVLPGRDRNNPTTYEHTPGNPATVGAWISERIARSRKY